MHIDEFNKIFNDTFEYPNEKKKRLFYKIMNEEKPYSRVYFASLFEYAYCFYVNGDNHKVKKLIEPFVINYKDYKYCPELIGLHLLLGLSYKSGGDNILSRYYLENALILAKKHKDNKKTLLALNNMASAYFSEGEIDKTISLLNEARDYLDENDDLHASLLMVNLAVCYNKINEIDKAYECFDVSMNKYNAMNNPVKSMALCIGLELEYKKGNMDRFNYYKELILNQNEAKIDGETISAYETLITYSIETGDDDLYNSVDKMMDDYINANPQEYRFAMKMYENKVEYYKKHNDSEKLIDSLEKMNHYARLVIESMDKKNTEAKAKEAKLHTLKTKNEERRKQNELLRKLSYTDSLTGIYNRHAFNMVLQGNQKNKCNSLVLAILDIDDFKGINDNYSHIEGDNVLSCVGDYLKRFSDDKTKCYRYGGDEFVILIADAEIDKAISRLTKFHRALNNCKKTKAKFSCSIGVSVMEKPVDVLKLFEEADAKLYRAKETKNKLVY